MSKITTEEKLKLMRRNTVEIINEEELKQYASSDKPPRVYCGYETSGEVHLGHLVTITKLIDFENAGCEVQVLFADWHTWLNRKGTWEEIHELQKLWEKVFKAAGLKKTKFVTGSSFQRSLDYIDDLMSLSLGITLNRALRSMQEVGRDMEHAKVSQMIYPLMQANDIKAMGVDIAYSGIEQRKIHMLARELLPSIGYKAPTCVHTPLVPSLGKSGKMSSSVPESMISLRDDDKIITKKISKAHCPEGVIKDNPILSIAKLLVFPRIDSLKIERPEKFGGNLEYENYEALEKAFEGKELHPMDLKQAVSKELCLIIAPIRESLE